MTLTGTIHFRVVAHKRGADSPFIHSKIVGVGPAEFAVPVPRLCGTVFHSNGNTILLHNGQMVPNALCNIGENVLWKYRQNVGTAREYRYRIVWEYCGPPDFRRVRDGTSTDSRKGCGTGSGRTPIK
jgi:hypothetical protein